jgi:DNA-binding SARP family transcriptional activator
LEVLVKLVGCPARGILALAIASAFFSACDKSEKEKSSTSVRPETSAQTSKSAEPKKVTETGFDEMAASAIKQAASQGLQIDPSNKEALARLIRIYLVRGDLHKAFGNPEKFNLTALIQWAAGPGLTVDYDKPKLSPYADALASMSRKTNAAAPIYVRVE